MLDGLRRVLERDDTIAYAFVFGSAARGAPRHDSDVDVAVELRPGTPNDVHALGRRIAGLESAVGRAVDLVLMEEASPALRYRVFRDGRLLVERDHRALVARKAQAILAYLDFRPVEERCAAGVLRVAALRGR